jgi:RHS repeat-associated protein
MKKILSLFVLLPIMVVGQTQTENYIKTKTYKVPTTTSIATPTILQASQNVTYFDGLGRPIQQVAHQQSGTGKDLVTPIAYDGFGRQEKDYLPYAPTTSASLDYKPSALTEVNTFYNTAVYENTANPYSQKLFEASPLNRVLQQAAPGESWKLGNGHEIKINYQTNTASEVKLFSATATWNLASGLYDISLGNATATVFYAANQLYKSVIYDENTAATPTESNGSTVEFKDKEGKVVLKRTYESGNRHDTYYVYDQYGNLTYVIPPKADAAITTAILNDLCYQYKYDYRNRLVEKKLPGKQWEFIVYDKLDRVVASSPAFSPFSDSPAGTVGWMITKYDVFNRPVYTGWEQSTTVTSAGRLSKQNTMNGLTTISESKTTTPTTIDALTGIAYYTNTVTPTSFKLLTINYYDDYNFRAFTPAIAYTAPVAYNNTTLKPKGLLTGSWVRVLTTLVSTVGESSYILYDAKARPIKSFTANYLGGYTQTDSNLDAFSGRLNFTETRHKRIASDTEIYIKEAFTYSAQDRLLTHTHQIGTAGTPQLLAENKYDELGQLIGKNVGNTTALPLQKVDYAYNIRGWLKGINDIVNLSQSGAPKDLFAFKINYNTSSGTFAGIPLFNGNISQTHWTTSSDNIPRMYNYYYDKLNRLNEAKFFLTGSSLSFSNSFREIMSYDRNGNISSIFRSGFPSGNYEIAIDNLQYTNQGNQLTKVSDTSNNTAGFSDGNTIGDDYSYDANGNMTIDKNKGIITPITYNHLNLPTKITFSTAPTGNIDYIYNANGIKVQKTVVMLPQKSSTITTRTITNYLTGFQYNTIVQSSPVMRFKQPTTQLQFVPTAEGYYDFVKNGYVYNYTDHLGNVRLSYQDINKDGIVANSEILEESNYYPFGMKHNGYNSGNLQPNYKYKYQGQELQDELGLGWYSFKWRNYDPTDGRFMSIDPLTEEYHTWSPYVFSGNRVVDSRELEGLEPVASRTGTKNLIIVNQGYVGNPPFGATQAQNAGKTMPNMGVDYSGLGKISSLDSARNGTQVAVFASSQGDETKNDIVSSINSFKSQNKDGNVILVGHSLGADNMIEMVNEHPSIKVDFMLTIDTADDYDDDNIPSNVKSIVNYYVQNDGIFGSSVGGEKIEVDDPLKTKGINVPVNSSHIKIDNDYIQNFMNRINSFLNQQSDEKKK